MAKKATITTETFDTAIKSGADAVKDSFQKVAKGYDMYVEFSKTTAEAMMKAANAATKGFESINTEAFAYAKKSVEESVAATRAILGSKSVNQAIQLQTEFGKSAFETYVDELTKFGDLALSTAKGAAEPLQERVTAFVELVQAQAA